jgi:hypothetical protein
MSDTTDNWGGPDPAHGTQPFIDASNTLATSGGQSTAPSVASMATPAWAPPTWPRFRAVRA